MRHLSPLVVSDQVVSAQVVSAFRRTLLIAITTALAVSTAACDRTESSNAPITTTSPAGTSTAPSPESARHRDEALVRIVNASFGGNVDLFAGDLLLFDGLAFKTVTPYRALDGQRYAFALRPAGMPQAKPLDSNTEGLVDGGFYTAVVLPDEGRAPRLRIVSDTLAKPASGKARLRVIHGGADAGRIVVRAAGAGDALVDGVEYQSVTDYQDVTPVSGVVEIVADAASAPVLASFSTHMEAGRFYTIVIAGRTRSAPTLEAFLIEDALSP